MEDNQNPTNEGGAPETPSPEQAIARFQSRRSGVIYALRTGRTQPGGKLPVDRLPQE